MKTAEQIHAEVGTRIPSLTPALEKYRAFTVADIAKIIDEAKGGVCEWKRRFALYSTTCQWDFTQKDGHYCPGCGKEIKIV